MGVGRVSDAGSTGRKGQGGWVGEIGKPAEDGRHHAASGEGR